MLLVNSSTNSGTPSLLATIAATVSADSLCEAATPATRPRGHHGKQSGRTDAVGQARHKFKRGGIDPVSVFQNQKHRIGLAKADELVDQEGNDRRLALCWRQRQRGRRWDCQQFRQQRNRGCVRRRPFGEQGAEFLDSRTWQVRGGEAGGATQMLDHRVKRAVAVIGRALQMDAGVRLGD